MKRVGIYLRVSTKAQDTRAQATEMEAWAGQLGKDVEVQWFKDKATGTNMERPAFQKLMEAVARGEIDTIAVWRLDRLGRTAAGLTNLFEDLARAKVNLVSRKDGLDMATSAGRLMANVIASVAQYETEVRSERQMAGIRAAQAAGKRWGGSVKGRRIRVTDDHVEQARALRGQGKSITAISKLLRLSRPTVYRVLSQSPIQ